MFTFSTTRRPPLSTLFPYTTLFRSRREPGGEEPLRHGAGGARRVPQRVGGIDLDQLAEDVARRLAVGGRAPRLRGRRAADRYRRHEKRPQQDPRWIHLTLAIASISTRTAFGNAAACMVERAGLCVGKYFAYTSFIAEKSAMSTRYTVVFTTRSNPDSAALRIAPRFLSICSACSAVVLPTMPPVLGSSAICPAVYTMPSTTTAWL